MFVSSDDIEPDEHAQTLTIRIHRMADPAHVRTIAAHLEERNQFGFQHPNTATKMTFALF